MLGDLGATITAQRWCTLVTDDPATLPALTALARRCYPNSAEADTAAHIAWWTERADFPGSGAAVQLLTACRARWITGATPDAERHPATWRTWLRITDDGCAGLLTMLDRLTDHPPLPLLDTLTADDEWSWGRAQAEHADGRNWRTPDTAGRAAIGLRARCDAADLYAAALLADPLYRQRAVHTGHDVTGDVAAHTDSRNRITVLCQRMDARLRTGNAVTGWIGPPELTERLTFSGTVHATGVTGGRLALTLNGVNAHRPAPGQPVTLMPTPPSPGTMRAGRHNYLRLYANRRSWLTTTRTPVPQRRDVPLDVLVAGADTD